MRINFGINVDSTCYFNVEANIKILGHGVISLSGDDYEFIPGGFSKDDFVDWIYEEYLLDMGYDEDNTTLNEEDVELSYKKYLEAHE